MRIVHVTTELPHPDGISGGSSRQFHLDAHLVKLGHEVTVIAPVSRMQERALRPAEMLGAAGIRLVPTPRRSTRGREALSAVIRRPSLLPRSATIPFYGLQTEMLALGMRSAISRVLDQEVDVVAVDHDFSVHLGDYVPDRVPMVLSLHNDTVSYYRARARSATGVTRALLDRQALLADKYITPRLDDFAALVTVSEADADLIRARTRREVVVVPNGTDTSATSRAHGDSRDATVLFSGTMSHPPNHEGVMWFYSEVWPKVREAVPGARLVVAGRNPKQELVDLCSADESVEVTGEVPSMGPYFEKATVAVVPLRAGGGTRLKILDALSAMLPTVTTDTGREGLKVEDGVHLLVANDTEEFAQRTTTLLTDSKLATELARRGRRLVEEDYDWQLLGRRFACLLRRVAEGAT